MRRNYRPGKRLVFNNNNSRLTFLLTEALLKLLIKRYRPWFFKVPDKPLLPVYKLPAKFQRNLQLITYLYPPTISAIVHEKRILFNDSRQPLYPSGVTITLKIIKWQFSKNNHFTSLNLSGFTLKNFHFSHNCFSFASFVVLNFTRGINYTS